MRSNVAGGSYYTTRLICLTARHSIRVPAADLTRYGMDLIESRILPWPTYGCTRLLNDAFELKTYEHYCDHHKRTLPTSCRLFSYFGAAATSFLVKTFYYATEHVIDDFARLTKYPVDQHTAESDKTVYETTYY